ncbi:MAG: hypothetical protein ABS69_01790 [Nitrosomonadales bacterium SCN 54-20]|nr:MAG: hypothetical protein ABS69_01790 [Nitrosomonadales bacterium SCN 54-20]
MDRVQRRLLDRVDWDFVGSHFDLNPALHWYPGNFIPELPGALIDILSKDGDRVFDPFGGVGTTAIAALTRGRTAVCCDANPIAVLTSYVTGCLVMLRCHSPLLLERLFDELSVSASGVATSAHALPLVPNSGKDLDNEIEQLTGTHPRDKVSELIRGAPLAADLERWYSPRTLHQFLDLNQRILAASESSFATLTGAAMLSSISRALSSQTRSWGHIADRVLPKELVDKNPSGAAEAWIKRIRRRIYLVAQKAQLPSSRPALTVIRRDWASKDDGQHLPKATLLITSPPYAGAIDYTLAQRLSLGLFGYDAAAISKLTSIEMGARRKRFDTDHVSKWADALCAATSRQLEYLAPSSTAAFVMPHKDAGREMGAEKLKQLMDSKGWVLDFEVDRSIRQVKARQSWTSIKRETILVFSR